MDGPPRAGQLGHCVAVPVLVPVTAPEARCLPGGRELGLSRVVPTLDVGTVWRCSDSCYLEGHAVVNIIDELCIAAPFNPPLPSALSTLDRLLVLPEPARHTA